MKKLFLLASCLQLMACTAPTTIQSPDGKNYLTFELSPSGEPTYAVRRGAKTVVAPSIMGFEVKEGADYTRGFKIKKVSHESHDEIWEPVWGENSQIRDNYNAMTVELVKPTEAGEVRMNIVFRAYDDGIGFRYIFPEQSVEHLTITDEVTSFAMPGDITAWWIPGDYDTQEYEYTRCRLSEIRKYGEQTPLGNISQTSFSPTSVQTSLMLKTDDPLYLNIHEAAVVDFPAMHLDLNDTTMVFKSWLTPDRNGNKAEIDLPFKTPWRAVMIAPKATGILASNLILNLNDPCALEDTSWIHPVKYMGVWWEMITGKSSWSYCDAHNFDLATFDYSKAKPHGHHAANNANVRRYIDFAAEHGFDQLLIEGWNVGWEDWYGKEKDFVFDFLTPYPDFDIKALNEYAHSKGIRLMMHHETSASIPNYERWIDQAYDLMNEYGYDAVKSGYVGNILPKGENHYNQNSVNHYLMCIKKAAEKHIMVNAHEAIRPSGLCRTYPNMVGNESAMGTEYQFMTPGHEAMLSFTRLKGGPMDFTPGIFRTDLNTFSPTNHEKKRATTCNQLALYVTMYSPLQMAADLPEHYAEKMDAFQFIKDVPVDWSKSIYIDAEPAEFIIAARRDKKSNDWYVGGITDQARTYQLNFEFLDPNVIYLATVYRDADDADCDRNPEAYVISRHEVDWRTTMDMKMAHGGGFAISIKATQRPADEPEEIILDI